MTDLPAEPTAQAVTRGPKHHFFGYYDKCPWDATGRYLLALEVPFMDRPPTAADVAAIGLIDLENDYTWRPIAETRAFNWQQGSMLQWLGGKGVRPPDVKGSDPFSENIIYNDRQGDAFVSVIRDVQSGAAVRTLPRTVAAVSRDGRQAVCLNFARVHRHRPGYGYVAGNGGHDAESYPPFPPHPAADGIWWMDLETGENRLIVSLDEIVRFQPRPAFADTTHWFNHLQFNTDGSRFCFLHRWWVTEKGDRWETRLYTANPDGSERRLLADDGLVSHFDWRDATHLLAYARVPGAPAQFYLFDDETGQAKPVSRRAMPQDGHSSYSPDHRLILCDTYPNQEQMRTIYVYRPADDLRIELGRFHSPPALTGEIRCDLHPRWSRDGTAVCFDSAHEGTRQMYLLDFHEPRRDRLQVDFSFR